MANYQSTHTGAEIDVGIDLLDKNSATSGQVLTANGTGGASWQNTSGTSIGGGYEIFSTFQGAPSDSKFLILGKRAIDGVYGLHNKYDDIYAGKIVPNSTAYTNVSIVIPLYWGADSFYVRDYSSLRAYDGTVLTSSNRETYINNICYLVKNADFIEYD